MLRLASKGRLSRALRRLLLLAQATAAIAIATPSEAMILGADRAGQGTGWATDASGQFDGVGRIECRDPRNPAFQHIATGWLVGAADTVVTAAHTFFKRKQAGGTAARTIDPTGCTFVLYGEDGQVRETAGIRYGLSQWADDRLRGDSSHDVAVLKLDRPVKAGAIPAVKTSNAMQNPAIRLVAFQTGVARSDHVWLTNGQMTSFPTNLLLDPADGTRVSDTRRMFASSADSSPSSSGGMYFDNGRQVAIGIHIGSLCGESQSLYDPESCFNYGLRFDAKIVGLIESVAGDRPLVDQLIRPAGELAAAIQMVMLDPMYR